MKKIEISIPVDYIMGHLRYGHLEGEIMMTDEEFEKFTSNPAETFDELQLDESLNLIVDDWEIDTWGDLDFSAIDWEEKN